MASFHGKDGTATWGGDIKNIVDWTVDMNSDFAEVDYMAATGDAKIKHQGHWRWTATINTYHDDATAWTANPITSATAASSAELVLTAISGVSFTGNAWCTSANVSGDVGGSPTVSYSFVGDGNLTLAP